MVGYLMSTLDKSQMTDPTPVFDHLKNIHNREWIAVTEAINRANTVRSQIAQFTGERSSIPVDTALIVLGSLGRGEWTNGSDVDWTLLVDGLVDPDHINVTAHIEKALVENGFAQPGPTGVFGHMAVSHDLVHQIGGQNDTNINTSQRILLLLESKTIGSDDSVRDRVIRAILHRYLEGESEGEVVIAPKSDGYKIPRFLLNDIVRFWRTMAVDYAYKWRERRGTGWALRNIKLRMSRKLIFTYGLFVCLGCRLKFNDIVQNEYFSDWDYQELPLLNYLRACLELSPLEFMAGVLLCWGKPATQITFYDSYNQFLAILDDPDKRAHLKSLPVENAEKDTLFFEARNVCNSFQNALLDLCFHDNEQVCKLSQDYGLF